jgi:hypothetical protein
MAGLPRFGPTGVSALQAILIQLATDEKHSPFSRKVWRGIRNGTVQF